MAISFNTGATGGTNTSASTTVVIPAGVLVGDVMLMALSVFTEVSTAPTISFSGAGGSWTLIPVTTGANPETSTSGSSVWEYGYGYYRVATAGDQGATLTITESGSAAATTWIFVAIAAYTGANTSSPIDVAGGATNSNTGNTVTCPTMTTGVANDWAVFLGPCAPGSNATLTGPNTSRENIVNASSGVGSAVNDSNSSFASGSSIGGGTFSSSIAGNQWMTAFTVGLAPASSGAPPSQPQPGAPAWQRRYRPPQVPYPPLPAPAPLPPQTQPGAPAWQQRYRRLQVPPGPLGSPPAVQAVPAPTQLPPIPRRTPARAVWRGSAPFLGYVAVPAPPRLPPIPRRTPGRAVWRGSAPFLGFVAVPAPAQEPPIPRRKPTRAVWKGSAPFLGYVAVPAPHQPPYLPPRRTPARAVWRGSAPFLGFVAVPAPRQQPTPAPRRKPARAVVQFTPVTTTNAAPVVATTSAGPALGVLPYAGGVLVQSYTQTFTASGTWTAPPGLAGPPAVYAWGPSGTAASGTAGTGAGGGGGGALGGEPALGGVTAGTTLTITVGAAGSGTATTVTGGSVTVTGNAGGNAVTGTGGTAGAASANTVTFAGGAGGNGAAGGSGGGGGGGGSAGSTGAGGTGNPGVSTTGGTGGAAGTGAAGLAGAAGGNGGTGSSGGAGNAPGGAGGGGSGGAIHSGGAATAGQAVIIWQVITPVLMASPRRKLARATVFNRPVITPVVGISGQVQPNIPVPRRRPARAVWRGSAPFLGYVAVPAPRQQPGPAPRRRLARAYVRFTPVATTNATAPVLAGTPPAIPTSGGTINPWIRTWRAIAPGDVPASGAELPKIHGRGYIGVADGHVEDVIHEPTPVAGPSVIDLAADAAAAAARQLGEIKAGALEVGRIFADPPYERQPKKCGAIRKVGGVMLTCARRPGHQGKHSDRGLDWR